MGRASNREITPRQKLCGMMKDFIRTKKWQIDVITSADSQKTIERNTNVTTKSIMNVDMIEHVSHEETPLKKRMTWCPCCNERSEEIWDDGGPSQRREATWQEDISVKIVIFKTRVKKELYGNFKDVRFFPMFNFGHFWAALLKISGFLPHPPFWARPSWPDQVWPRPSAGQSL